MRLISSRGFAGRRLGAGLLALVLFTYLPAGCGDSSPEIASLRSQETQPPSGPARHVPPQAEAAFTPFRSPPEGLPGRVTQVLSKPMGGANWKLSQRLHTAAGPAVWTVPGRGLICLVSQVRVNTEVFTTCTHTRRAVEDGILLVSLAPRKSGLGRTKRFVVGMVPDGTRSVRVYTPGTPVETAGITNSTFTLLDAIADPPGRVELLP